MNKEPQEERELHLRKSTKLMIGILLVFILIGFLLFFYEEPQEENIEEREDYTPTIKIYGEDIPLIKEGQDPIDSNLNLICGERRRPSTATYLGYIPEEQTIDGEYRAYWEVLLTKDNGVIINNFNLERVRNEEKTIEDYGLTCEEVKFISTSDILEKEDYLKYERVFACPKICDDYKHDEDWWWFWTEEHNGEERVICGTQEEYFTKADFSEYYWNNCLGGKE